MPPWLARYHAASGLYLTPYRAYDPKLGRWLSQDPIGEAGGLNLYGYVGCNPGSYIDPWGLTEVDVQMVLFDVLNSFSDLDPANRIVHFENVTPADGRTSKWGGRIYVNPSWADRACFTKGEYEDLFFLLFHEAMHSSDNIFIRYYGYLIPGHHDSIYNRAGYEQAISRPTDAVNMEKPSPMWGTPRAEPVDKDQLYRNYCTRTPACRK